LALNLPLIGMWVQILKIPYKTLFPLILLFCLIGVYCASGNVFDIYIMVIFGALGYILVKLGYEPAPLVMAFVLGPILERNLRQALIMSGGSMGVFFSSPISAASLLMALFMVVSATIPSLQRKRKQVITEE
jgi:putative tricarboxylic transport membrane protein